MPRPAGASTRRAPLQRLGVVRARGERRDVAEPGRRAEVRLERATHLPPNRRNGRKAELIGGRAPGERAVRPVLGVRHRPPRGGERARSLLPREAHVVGAQQADRGDPPPRVVVVPLAAALALACGDGGCASRPAPDDVVGHAYAFQTVSGQPLPVPTPSASGGPALRVVGTRSASTPASPPPPPRSIIMVSEGVHAVFDPPPSGRPTQDRRRTGEAVQAGDSVRLTLAGFEDPIAGAAGTVTGPTLTLRYTARAGGTRPEPWVYQRVR